ncbi:MAG: hypothetical protein CMF96_10085 [Candidatus Marinimicrobia bacterium]|nr:hypothetical protein [Candidatus Neomarinimicrobiota bacterium]|tara:strand:- start:670 stop:3318 length:2649 start_codon:yes stop_codon:yes gene_type:complete
MNRILRSLLLALIIFNNLLLIAQKESIEIRDKSNPIVKKTSKGTGKSFYDIVKGMDEINGLFTMFWDKDKDKVYLKIKQTQLDKVYFCDVTRSSGDAFMFDSGAMLQSFPFIFKKVGDRIQFIHKNVMFRAEPDAAISRAIDNSFSHSIIGSAPIVGLPNEKDGSILIDAKNIFIQDIPRVSLVSGYYQRKFNLDKQNSYFTDIASFKSNTEIDVALHFKNNKPKSTYTLPDPTSMVHKYHFSLSEIPVSDFKPRLADDRIGHFLTMYQDYSSLLKDSPYVRYVNRWHLEKAEPRFDISKPKKPIVYWIENTVPVEYRDAVKEGVLLWNDAFEKIGIKEAIVVKQMPDDAAWDPGDVRYNVIRWIIRPGSGYAVGPSKANPYTGELYAADIRVSSDFVRSFYRRYTKLIGGIDSENMGVDEAFNSWWKNEVPEKQLFNSESCHYASNKMEEIDFAWNYLSGTGALTEGDLKQFVHDGLVDLIVHEVGHTLGLRHNFKASTIFTSEQLKNKEFTDEHGITGSVMDYNPVNLSSDKNKKGNYFQTKLGYYDYWAIEYAYGFPKEGQSEADYLKSVASRVSEPYLQYGTDEDAHSSSRGIDPMCTRYDMSSDAIQNYGERIELANELWDNMLDKFEKNGERYTTMRSVFSLGVSQYARSIANTAKFVGGIYHRRDHIGDPNGRIPFEVVPSNRQREAVRFLSENILHKNSFDFDPELLNKLAPERLNDFKGTPWRTSRIDFPIRGMVQYLQSNVLFSLYAPLRMQRMLDNELKFKNNKDKFTLSEMFEILRSDVWKEVEKRENVNSYRRELQRVHLKMLIHMAIKSNNQFPRDAISLARADLDYLQKRISRLTKLQTLDSYTKAHMAESLSQIEAALSAQLPKEY